MVQSFSEVFIPASRLTPVNCAEKKKKQIYEGKGLGRES
jgi:hypothetical protein